MVLIILYFIISASLLQSYLVHTLLIGEGTGMIMQPESRRLTLNPSTVRERLDSHPQMHHPIMTAPNRSGETFAPPKITRLD